MLKNPSLILQLFKFSTKTHTVQATRIIARMCSTKQSGSMWLLHFQLQPCIMIETFEHIEEA